MISRRFFSCPLYFIPNLGLPLLALHFHNRHPSLRYSFILSASPNHINTYWSTLPTNSLFNPVLSVNLFFPNSIHSCYWALPYFWNTSSQAHSLFFYLHFVHHVSAPFNAVDKSIPSYRHFRIYTQSSFFLRTLFNSPHALDSHIYYMYHMHFTSSVRCHLRPQVLCLVLILSSSIWFLIDSSY